LRAATHFELNLYITILPQHTENERVASLSCFSINSFLDDIN